MWGDVGDPGHRVRMRTSDESSYRAQRDVGTVRKCRSSTLPLPIAKTCDRTMSAAQTGTAAGLNALTAEGSLSAPPRWPVAAAMSGSRTASICAIAATPCPSTVTAPAARNAAGLQLRRARTKVGPPETLCARMRETTRHHRRRTTDACGMPEPQVPKCCVCVVWPWAAVKAAEAAASPPGSPAAVWV